jgi:ABC-type phosphate transport system permease subunit
MVTIRAARSGILASIILGMGRAIGETMAVIMVAGNAVKIPHSALESVRSLTANIALEMSYATGLHRQALFATGVILFVVIIILNSAAMVAIRGKAARK